jgi:hypothetical protein
MDPSIRKLVSTLSYHGKLQDAPEVIDHPTTSLAKTINAGIYNCSNSVVFLNIANSTANKTVGESYENLDHAALVMNLVANLLDNGIRPEQILILTPYHSQYRVYLGARLEMQVKRGDPKIREILVRKVDGFQGGEQDICILDLTVTNRLGFLKEGNRINVGLSRGRWGLYIVGNIKAMESGLKTPKDRKEAAFMCNLISYSVKNRLVYQVGGKVESEFVSSGYSVVRSGKLPVCQESNVDINSDNPNTSNSAVTNKAVLDDENSWVVALGSALGGGTKNQVCCLRLKYHFELLSCRQC